MSSLNRKKKKEDRKMAVLTAKCGRAFTVTAE